MADFAEETQKINIALAHTDGNMDLAKKMVSGSYKDLYTIKGRAELSGTHFGFFILNVKQKESALGPSFFFSTMDRQGEQTKPFMPVIQLIKSICQMKDADKEDMKSTSMLSNAFQDVFATKVGPEVVQAAQHRDIDALTKLINFIISSKLNFNKVNLLVELEETSSFDWEYKDFAEGKLSPVSIPLGAPTEAKPEQRDILDSPDIKAFEKRYSRVLDADVVVSPVKGTVIRQLLPGQKIKIILPTRSEEEENFARARGGFNEEGQAQPVVASFRRYINLPGGQGYIIYADLPGKVLCRAFEESMVKVATAEGAAATGGAKAAQPAAGSSDSGSLMPAVIGVVVLILMIVIALMVI